MDRVQQAKAQELAESMTGSTGEVVRLLLTRITALEESLGALLRAAKQVKETVGWSMECAYIYKKEHAALGNAIVDAEKVLRGEAGLLTKNK